MSVISEAVRVSSHTVIVLLDGIPAAVVSTSRNLDNAFDAAAQHFGAPLDGGEWEILTSKAPAFVRVAVDGVVLAGADPWFISVSPASVN